MPETFKMLEKINSVITNTEISEILSEKKIIGQLNIEISILQEDLREIQNMRSNPNISSVADMNKFIESKFRNNERILNFLNRLSKTNCDNIRRLKKTIESETNIIIKEIDRFTQRIVINQNDLMKINQYKQILSQNALTFSRFLEKEFDALSYIKGSLIPEIGTAQKHFMAAQNADKFIIIDKLEKVKDWLISVQQQAHVLFENYEAGLKLIQQFIKYEEQQNNRILKSG